MLRKRRLAAEAVGARFVALEAAVDAAAAMAADCTATMLQQRCNAGLPIATGLDALQLVSEAGADLVRARRRLVEAHAALVEVRTSIGLRAMYGDELDCPPAIADGPVAVRLVANG